jgi:hypothetical protein
VHVIHSAPEKRVFRIRRADYSGVVLDQIQRSKGKANDTSTKDELQLLDQWCYGWLSLNRQNRHFLDRKCFAPRLVRLARAGSLEQNLGRLTTCIEKKLAEKSGS